MVGIDLNSALFHSERKPTYLATPQVHPAPSLRPTCWDLRNGEMNLGLQTVLLGSVSLP